jgi:AcrR family transcriptional regulator
MTASSVRADGERNPRMRARILDGAVQAIARHGLAKLGMSDVIAHAGVSRGTLYRYFQSREDLLQDLAAVETERFQQRLREALQAAPSGEARLRLALLHVARYVDEHPAIRSLIDHEPAFVLRYLRRQFRALSGATGAFLAPLLQNTRPVRGGVATSDQLVDWLTRIMISAVLFPDPDPEGMARSLTAVYRLLAAAPERAAARRRRRTQPTSRTNRKRERRR